MAARYSWKGYLRLSLVSCPVHLAPAVSGSERVTFHLLNPKTNNRIQTRTVDPETGEEVPRSELVKGYEFEKGRYVIVSKKELDELQIESSKVIDIERFVARDSIRPVFFDAPYYLAPDGKMADETFRVIREAMAETGKVGIGRVVLSSREHPVMLEPEGKGILMMTLRAAEEVRSAEEYFDELGEGKVEKDMVELATKIIEQKSDDFDPEALTGDRYQQALRELVSAKIKGEKPVVAKISAPSNVINLMDALRKSVTNKGEPPESETPSRKKTAARSQAKEEAEPAFAGRKPRSAPKRKKRRA